MSSSPVIPIPKLTATQLIERELQVFLQRREQAVANLHAIEGAIQGAQHLLGTLEAEAKKAEVTASQPAGIGGKGTISATVTDISKAAKAPEPDLVNV